MPRFQLLPLEALSMDLLLVDPHWAILDSHFSAKESARNNDSVLHFLQFRPFSHCQHLQMVQLRSLFESRNDIRKDLIYL
jgi:hypothetical protein